MEIHFSHKDTFHYDGADYGFDEDFLNSFSELDGIIRQKELEGYTKCFIHEVFNIKNELRVKLPYSNSFGILIRFKFLK
jgi:hypothetical protein